MKYRKRKKKNPTVRFMIAVFATALAVLILAFLLKGGSDENKDPSEQTSGIQTSSGSAVTDPGGATSSESPATEGKSTGTQTDNTKSTEKTSTGPQGETQETAGSAGGSNFTKEELSKWYLKYVSPTTPKLPQDYAPPLAVVQEHYVHKNIKEPLEEMIQAAKNDGVTLTVISAFRSFDRQTSNFEARVSKYVNQGMSQDEAEVKTAAIIAVPGTSEHQLGLAVDFNSLDQTFENTSAGKWLKENAYRFGFILRYEKGKEPVTGIVFEPWHYRYVSVPHAKKIKELGVTLDEYLELLKSGELLKK